MPLIKESTFLIQQWVIKMEHAEEYLGRAIKEFSKREDVVIATKFMPRSQVQIDQGVSAREHIETCLNNSLKRLQMDYVDLYILHRWDNVTPIKETMES